jgi:hypothetical protein
VTLIGVNKTLSVFSGQSLREGTSHANQG